MLVDKLQFDEGVKKALCPFMSSNDLYGNGDDGSYFVKHDELTDVVACPGIAFPSLANSCYVPIEDILDIEEE